MRSRPRVALLASLLGVLLAGAATTGYAPDAVDALAAASRANLAAYLDGHPTLHNCTLATAARRFEWSDLPPAQRRAYVAAVGCLQTRPPRSDPARVPGARSRFDDFVAVHIERSASIHATANFLTWHRYFTWAYEQALRDECGYTGYQPYWNWDRYAADPSRSPLFDGSATSMSGNGAYAAYPGLRLPLYAPPYDVIPPDAGGGCVTTGPFANMTVNLGPVFAGLPDVPANPRPDGLGHNPRCLRRDLNRHAAAQTTADRTATLVRASDTLADFQDTMNGRADRGDWGVHTSGHFTVGGDPGGDFFVSPGDPAFYLHHAMIDRVYWTWQLRGLPGRLAEVAGTLTPANSPPSRPGTRDDPLDLGVLAPAATLGDALDTMGGLGGRFCYVYD